MIGAVSSARSTLTLTSAVGPSVDGAVSTARSRLTSGAVAARRTHVSPGAQSPALLRVHAVATARMVVNQAGTDERRGAGMIDVGNFVV